MAILELPFRARRIQRAGFILREHLWHQIVGHGDVCPLPVARSERSAFKTGDGCTRHEAGD